MWSKPSYIELDRKTVMERINAKAWTVGDAMDYGDLCDQGVGATGVIQLPDGVIEEAVVESFNWILRIFKIRTKSGRTYHYDPQTGVLY